MSEDKELWMTRAAACELLALSLRYPTDELARILASGEWADAAREIAAALGAELSEDAMADLPGAEGGSSDARAEELLLSCLRLGKPRRHERAARSCGDGVRAA